jgi:glycosyltransferase involved in cell wall biosynthesis
MVSLFPSFQFQFQEVLQLRRRESDFGMHNWLIFDKLIKRTSTWRLRCHIVALKLVSILWMIKAVRSVRSVQFNLDRALRTAIFSTAFIACAIPFLPSHWLANIYTHCAGMAVIMIFGYVAWPHMGSVGRIRPAEAQSQSVATKQLPVRVAFLTNFIPPYILPVLQRLKGSVNSLRVFISTAMEADRPWQPVWDGLDVVQQKTITGEQRRRYKQGYAMSFVRHFPYDTLPLLYRYKPNVIISGQLGFRTLQAIVYRKLNPASRLAIWVDASEHTEHEIGKAQTAIRKLFLRAADAIIVNGASGSRYVQMLGVSSRRIVPVPFVSKVSALSEPNLGRSPKACRRMLYVGQLIERRGLDLFFGALARWAQDHRTENCNVWIVGDGPLCKELKQTELPPNIEISFFGNVPYLELAPYFINSGIFVLPTRSDTWGLVVNEALAAGLPVLGSLYSQAVEELVKPGVNGWTFYADQPKEFQNALTQALSTPVQTLNQMREHARASVQHLTTEFAADQLTRAIRVATHSHASNPNAAITIREEMHGQEMSRRNER